MESIGRIAGHCAGILLAIANVYEGHSHDPNIERIFDKLPEENTSWHMTKVCLKQNWYFFFKECFRSI